MTFILDEHPHRRFNPLTREWILVSPHRAKRPWKGKVEDSPTQQVPSYDPACQLCPRNIRQSGLQNPDYHATFVFDNDFPALMGDSPDGGFHPHPLIHAESERGLARVVCFAPQHNLTLAEMEVMDIRKVVDTWVGQYDDLGSRPHIGYVQVFENRGEVMGSSQPHPHGQIWASERLPQQIALEEVSQRDYWQQHGRSLLADYLSEELRMAERLIYQNDGFVVLVPFWAIWPYETILISKRHVPAMGDLIDSERSDLADALKQITVRYDNLFRTSFPYSMGFHPRPTMAGDWQHWHLHAHFYPPLLRSATVKKFMVGYEMLATPQRDITPEQAAARLRELSATHYKEAG